MVVNNSLWVFPIPANLGGDIVVQNGDGTVGKALEVLDMVAAAGRPIRFSDLLSEARFPKATLYRLLQTLCNQGMLTLDPDTQNYALGVRLVRMAHAAWAQSSLAPMARPHLVDLAADLGLTIHLAQLDHAQVLYVDKVSAVRPVEMFSQAGRVGPAYCTGVGKAMLAWLDLEAQSRVIAQQSFHQFTPATLTSPDDLRAELRHIAERGFAYDREEHEPGIICAAVPILSRRGRVLGALSATGTTGETSLDALATHVPRLRVAAAAIATDAESWRFPDLTDRSEPQEMRT